MCVSMCVWVLVCQREGKGVRAVSVTAKSTVFQTIDGMAVGNFSRDDINFLINARDNTQIKWYIRKLKAVQMLCVQAHASANFSTIIKKKIEEEAEEEEDEEEKSARVSAIRWLTG